MGDVEWRDRGYEIFQAIEKHARCTVEPAQLLDNMPKYYLG